MPTGVEVGWAPCSQQLLVQGGKDWRTPQSTRSGHREEVWPSIEPLIRRARRPRRTSSCGLPVVVWVVHGKGEKTQATTEAGRDHPQHASLQSAARPYQMYQSLTAALHKSVGLGDTWRVEGALSEYRPRAVRASRGVNDVLRCLLECLQEVDVHQRTRLIHRALV